MIKSAVAIFAFLLLISCEGGGGGGFDYTALGASDAIGVGATPITDGYVFLLERRLEAERGLDVDLENLGIPGAEVDTIEDLALPQAKKRNAELITIFTGANDIVGSMSVEDFERDLSDILQALRSDQPGAIIAIATMPDLTQLPRFVDNPDKDVTLQRIELINAAIVRQTAAVNAVIVPLFGIPFTDSEVSEDGYHPSDAGHAVIAQQFYAAIEPRLTAAGY